MKTFSLSTLSDVAGGKVAAAINEAIASCAADMRERPTSDKRRVAVQFEFRPIVDDGDVSECECAVRVKPTLPAYNAAAVSMRVADTSLRWNPASESNANQLSLDQANDREPADPVLRALRSGKATGKAKRKAAKPADGKTARPA
jgi:hypothetical protein